MDGYYGTGQSEGDQKRTLTLSNGEIIWDLSGNVNERVLDLIEGNQPGIIDEASYSFKDWQDVNNGIIPTINPFPENAYPGAALWDASS